MTSPVQVVVDALSVHFGGGTTYLTEQLSALRRVAPDLELRVLAGTWNAEILSRAVAGPVEVVHVPDGVGRVLWEQTALALRHGVPGVLYAPGGTAPLAGGRLPVVVAVQNPNYFGRGRGREHNQAWYRRTRTWLLRHSTLRADHVVAVSHAFGREVLEDLPELAGRVSVIPSGAPTLPHTESPPPGIDPDRRDFFLSLANDAPHKNLDLLVAAWADAASGWARNRVGVLVLAGDIPLRRRQQQRDLVEPHLRPHLVHLGPVRSREQVVWLLRRARALVSASALESFGFTTIEAGAAGCPVIATDIPAHRELADPHATFVPPDDRPALSAALRTAPSEPPRAPWPWPVTWDEHAVRLADVLRAVARRASVRVPA